MEQEEEGEWREDEDGKTRKGKGKCWEIRGLVLAPKLLVPHPLEHVSGTWHRKNAQNADRIKS